MLSEPVLVVWVWHVARRACYRALFWRGVLFQRAGVVLWSVPELISGVACCLSVPVPCPILAWHAGLLSACRGMLFSACRWRAVKRAWASFWCGVLFQRAWLIHYSGLVCCLSVPGCYFSTQVWRAA